MMDRLSRRRFLELAGATGALALTPRSAKAQTQTYDDGNSFVPGGLTSPVERVIVIGAGFAGLTVANALRAGGKQAVVLEGRDRIGGRVETRDVGGVPLDLGAAWIHGPFGNPLAEWAAQNGITLQQADPSVGDFSGYGADPAIGPVSSAETGFAFGEAGDFLDPFVLNLLRNALGPGASVQEGIVEYLDQGGYSGRLRSIMEFLMRSIFVELPYAGSAADMSLDWFYEDFGFSGLDHVPVGGYAGLVQAFDDDLDIRLNQTVTDIDYGPGGVTVTTNSEVHTGSHVVVTVPLGVLKAGAIAFDPVLPSSKTDALDRLEMGDFEKLYLQFGSAFWQGVSPPAEHSYYISTSPQPQGEYPVFLDWTPVTGAIPTLSCNVGGDFAATLTGMSEAAITARIVDILGEIFPSVPEATRTPTAVAISDWAGDPFSRGAYPYIPIGGSPFDMDELAEPVGGRVLFAGDATEGNYYGSAHGAMISGIREAKRLLAQPSVQLPEPRAWLLQGLGAAALLALARRRLRAEE